MLILKPIIYLTLKVNRQPQRDRLLRPPNPTSKRFSGFIEAYLPPPTLQIIVLNIHSFNFNMSLAYTSQAFLCPKQLVYLPVKLLKILSQQGLQDVLFLGILIVYRYTFVNINTIEAIKYTNKTLCVYKYTVEYH